MFGNSCAFNFAYETDKEKLRSNLKIEFGRAVLSGTITNKEKL